MEVSGIYIPGMEMPKKCANCKVEYSSFGGYYCPFSSTSTNLHRREERLSICPLIPVPDHGRLIDADVLSKAFRDEALQHTILGDLNRMTLGGGEVIDRIKNAPTIIPAERRNAMANIIVALATVLMATLAGIKIF